MLLQPHDALVHKGNALALMRSQFTGDNWVNNYRNDGGIPDDGRNELVITGPDRPMEIHTAY